MRREPERLDTRYERRVQSHSSDTKEGFISAVRNQISYDWSPVATGNGWCKARSGTRPLQPAPAQLEGVTLKYDLKSLISTDEASDSAFEMGFCSDSAEMDLAL